MNILIMTNMFPPITTGSSHYAKDLAMVMRKLGHNVTVVTVKLKINASTDKSYPFKLIRLPALHIKLTGFNWLTLCSLNPLNYFRLARIMRENNIDVVHQVNHYLDTAVLTRIVCKFKKIPYVVSIHTQLQFAPKIYTPLVRLLDKIIPGYFILKSSSKIISLDSEVARYLDNTYGNWLRKVEHKNKVVIIPHGIVIDETRFPVKTDYELSSLIVSVGHVIDARNRLNMIKAMKLIVKEFPKTRLEIIGHIYIDEPLKLIKELGLENSVYLTGERQYADTVERIRTADLHATWLNLEYVGLGTAAQESMLCGVPIVNNSPENLYGDNGLENMKNIVLIDHNNVEDIAGKIIALFKNKHLRESIGQNGRNYIKNNLDINIVAKKLEALYHSTQLDY